MDDVIRYAAGNRRGARYTGHVGTVADGLGDHVMPDYDQGRRALPARMSSAAQMNDWIRRSAGVSVRPDHQPVPEVGWPE